MLSGDSGQGESICTPRSVSKRLFGASGSSSKRNLFGQTKRVANKDAEMSEDSDLGPMSPLGLSDGNDSESSSDCSFEFPLATPEKSPRNESLQRWDRLWPSASRARPEVRSRAFDALKTLTGEARSCSNKKILQNSPKSSSSAPTQNIQEEKSSWVIGTPEREMAILFDEAIVPETPRKDDKNDNCEDEDCVKETPEKPDERSERRLVTPLSCVSNKIAIPRLHRRKSLCLFDNEETCLPEGRETTLKRRANDQLRSIDGAKIAKMGENYSSIPRARASLFPETKKVATSPQRIPSDFTLSTKTFYKSSLEKKRFTIGHVDQNIVERAKKRHSLPSFASNHAYHRRATKRSLIRGGEMNAGVRHGIKRPKPKRHVSRIEAFKTEKKKIERLRDANRKNDKMDKNHSSDSKMLVDSTPRPCPPSPMIDPNKRFFKTNRTLKSHHVATVTVNDKIKLKVSDGKIALNEKHSQLPRNPHKKARLNEISFDATDLTVDEPTLDSSMEKRNVVDGILKVLEDDWADDDYDTMETLTNSSPTRVTQTAMTNSDDVMMSPASVLSNMTLSMNIKDSAAAANAPENIDSTVKLYPLFQKGYSSNVANANAIESKNKCDRGLKRSWQTSAKGGGAEDQYQIDAGQKKFGATTCSECGIVYQLGDPEDENAHLNYHNNSKTLKFNGWKQEHVVSTDPFTNSRIIKIEPSDSKQCWKKVEQVLAVVDKDLGLAEMEVSSYLDKKIYFYVRDKTIIGVLVAESIKFAHRMIPEFADLNCCSAEETPAKCGINVIWTSISHRRQHIATKLLDTLRTTYFFGYVMSLEDIAFSIPTPSGKIFAEKYTKTQNFKVYS